MAREKIDSLTGLRGIAALWVALYHGVGSLPIAGSFPAVVGNIVGCGWLAVDLFFVLSGYVISYVHQRDFVRVTATEYVRFLKLRVARIYPAHCAVALLCVPVIVGAHFLLPGAVNPVIAERFNIRTLLYALTLLNGWGFPRSTGWNLPSWSVGSEWFAYLTFPFVALLANRLGSARAFVAIGAATMAITLLLSFLIRGGSTYMLPEAWSLVRVQSEFVLGCCVFGLTRYATRGRAYDALGATAALAIIGLTAIGAPGLLVAALIVSFAVLILGLATSDSVGALLATRPLVYLGEISYSLYLIHGLVLLLLKSAVSHTLPGVHPGAIGSMGVLALYLGAIVLAAAALYACVENPARQYLRRAWGTDRQSDAT
jgi:peptidoglycan/LPS O-acetylase OafA/YrhL